MKLAYVAQDRVDIAESVKFLKCTHDRAREVAILDEEQETRVHVSTTDVRCVVASARGFRLGQRLPQKIEHDGSVAETHVVVAHVCCVTQWRG